MAYADLKTNILKLLEGSSREGLSADAVAAQLRVSRSTVYRALRQLTKNRVLLRTGHSVSTRYALFSSAEPKPASTDPAPRADSTALAFSPQARQLLVDLHTPLASRTPVGYRRSFVDDYKPNESHFLPPEVAEALYAEGRTRDQQPAGTYARKVLEQLLIDLSWNSSRLEGNHFNLLDTRRLFELGRAGSGDRDATMLLNHKEAIEYMVDTVPERGISLSVVRNLHGILMQGGLLADDSALGTIRRRIINIEQSVYTPTQIPALLEEMLGQIVEKACLIKNPIEAAFFLWTQIAYLQPFEDGNKRTSRLSANLPLFLSNCSPISFLDVEIQDYAYAMLGVYERCDVSAAAELFSWTYRRSIEKYRVIRDAIGTPDPLRVKYRANIAQAIRATVEGADLDSALRDAGIAEAETAGVREIVVRELQNLEDYNCARFRLTPETVQKWIADGHRSFGPLTK